MILKAFSQVLHKERQATGASAEEILHRWLLEVLADAEPQDTVGRVIHTEIALMSFNRQVGFIGRSKSGEVLLESLYQYCDAYDRWQFGRWLHDLKPHAFNQILP